MAELKTKRQVDGFSIYLTREQALSLIKLCSLRSNPVTRELATQFSKEVRDIFVYEVKCRECGNLFEYRTQDELSDGDLKKTGICIWCQDDDK